MVKNIFIAGQSLKIYLYNRNLEFASALKGIVLYKTTNTGINWNVVLGIKGFLDIKFSDNLTGWKANGFINKTIVGGLNWIQQVVPSGGIILNKSVNKISVLNKDTIWGVGVCVFYGSGQFRGILLRTTNGVFNWLFQIPDTLMHLDYYSYIHFVNNNTGWVYRQFQTGIQIQQAETLFG